MGAYPYPHLPDFLPLPEPVAPKLPELTTCQCQDCEGTGYQATNEYDAHICPTCDGHSVFEVCSVCGFTPSVRDGLDVCGCNSERCESCGDYAETTEGICKACFRKGMDEALREEDPELFRYYELRDFDLPRSVIEQEMAIARAAGWVT